MHKATQLHTGFFEVNGTQLYYEMMGEGNLLVLLHGGYLDTRMWDDQFSVFANRYQVIRYDIRGFGKSALPQVPYADRQDLYELLKFLDIKKTYLLGLSLGGEIALDFTLEHPDIVDALILVGSPVSGYPYDVMLTAQQLQEKIQQQTPLANAIRERNVSAMIDLLMDNPTHVPTLLIVGEDDDIILHKSADKLEQDIVGARRVAISETHHMPNMEKPAEFNQIVLDFLDAL